MILKRALNVVAALAAVAAAVAVSVVAAAFALYALAAIWLTAAGSAAVVTLAFAAVALIVGRLAVRRATPAPVQPGPSVDMESLMARAMDFVRRRPIAAAAAAAAAVAALVIVWMRSPEWIRRVFQAFTSGPAEPEPTAGEHPLA